MYYKMSENSSETYRRTLAINNDNYSKLPI